MNIKSIFKKLLLAVSIIMCFITAAAQVSPPCENFATGIGNWVGTNATVTTALDALPSNGTDFLRGRDNGGTSFVHNDVDYNGTMVPCGGTLCWSFKIITDNNPNLVINGNPTIRIYTGNVAAPGLFATFRVANITINENAAWVTVCAPITPAVGGVIPAGWTMGNNGTPAQFNQLITTFTGIAFGTDIDPMPSTGEVIGIDNLCLTATVCCDQTDTPAFTIQTNCNNGVLSVTVTATDPNPPNHWWGLMQTSVAGQTTDAVTLNGNQPLGPVQSGASATFTITDFSKFYYIKHGIWSACYNWRETRIPIPLPQSDVNFHFLDSTKKIKDTFCFGEAINMYAYSLLPTTSYYIDAWRRPIGSAPGTSFSWYSGLGWTTGSPGLINLTTAFGALNPPVYFEPGYEYEIKLAVSNPSLCIGWSEVKRRFKVICCEKSFDAGFRINPEPNPSLPSNTLWANNFNTYSAAGAVHEWYVFSSPNSTGGPYTLVNSLTTTTQNPVLLYSNALHGVQYMVIHKIKTKCGEVCFSQTTCANCRAGDATIQVIDCSKLDSLLKGCTVPTGLVASCEKQEMVWNAVSSAVTYSIEVSFNDRACCRSSYSPSGFLWNHLTTPSLPFSSFSTVRYDCFRWRVKANCAKEESSWSDWQCFSCKKEGDTDGNGTTFEAPKRIGAKDGKANDIQPQIAPNPSNGNMVLSMKVAGDLVLSAEVFNAQGVRITTIARNTYRGGQFNYQLNLGRTASKGVYTIVFNTNYGTFRKKVIVN